MLDEREDILNNEYRVWVNKVGLSSIYPAFFPEAYKEAAMSAMDENGKRMCLELLDYVADKISRIDHDGKESVFITYKGERLAKEQLFENFL